MTARKRLIGAVVVSAAVILLASAALVIPLWLPLLPRDVRRGLTEFLLRAVLIGYAGLLLLGLVATPILAVCAMRARRLGRRRPMVARGFLIGISCILSLLLLELASGVWSLVGQRLPPLPMSFSEEDPAGSFRIVVLGGSSALGEPYRPWVSVGQIVAWQLGEADQSRRYECEILAWLGDSLAMQHSKLAAIKRRPGMVIVYSGHNEFAARYEEERDGWLDAAAVNRLMGPIYEASLASPFCRLAYQVISKNRLDEPPPLAGRHQLIDPPQCSPAEAEAIAVEFERRLEAITGYCERIGAIPVLIIPAANEADFEPSRSSLSAGVCARTARSWRANSAEPASGRRVIRLKACGGMGEFSNGIRNLPRRITGWRGCSRMLVGGRMRGSTIWPRWTTMDCRYGARRGCVRRMRVAGRHPSCVLIDGRRELAETSPRRLLDDHVIQDTHHPTLAGQTALAGAVLRELGRTARFEGMLSKRKPLEPAECARHFEIGALRWATMCERTSVHYRRVAGYRFDPAERLEKSRRYAEAAERIRRGVALEEIGMPGVGVGKPPGLESGGLPTF